ncbi:MAG: hypothetical protein KKA62_04395 [Nanoarchaeota archaeon]|nr:hypothetical protein [Nanoarchaeota archaeon]
MLSKKQLEKILEKSTKSKLFCRVDKLGASSQRKTYVCEEDEVKYKIRRCFSENDAQDIERRILDVCHLDLFPTYLGRYKEWLFFEYLDFPEARRNETEDFWYTLGKITAKLEGVSSSEIDVGFGIETPPIPEIEFGSYLHRCVELLQKSSYMDKNQTAKIQEALDSFLKTEPRTCYGYLDLLPGNIFMDNQKIILVDEEGLARTMQGLSLIRPLDIWKNYSPPQGANCKEREKLLEGYQDGGANREFYETNELHLGLIYYILKSADSIACSGKTNNSVKQLYSRLELL